MEENIEKNYLEVDVNDFEGMGVDTIENNTANVTDSKLEEISVSDDSFQSENTTHGNMMAFWITISLCILMGIVLGIILGRRSALK